MTIEKNMTIEQIKERTLKELLHTAPALKVITTGEEPEIIYDAGVLEYQARIQNILPSLITEVWNEAVKEATRCGKPFPDGSICNCKLDCHLHDWRQDDMKQQWQKEAREEAIKECEGCVPEELPEVTLQDPYAKELSSEDLYDLKIRLVVNRYSVKYAGCGSHQIEINAVTDLDCLQELYNSLIKIKGIDLDKKLDKNI